MKYAISAVILSVAILAHAFITKPIPPGIPIRISKSEFAKATREAVSEAATRTGNPDEFEGVDIDEVRFSHDGTLVVVEYTVRLKSKRVSSGVVLHGDQFGRYSGKGSFDGLELVMMVK
jgi:hypothetical protein